MAACLLLPALALTSNGGNLYKRECCTTGYRLKKTNQEPYQCSQLTSRKAGGHILEQLDFLPLVGTVGDGVSQILQ